MGKSLATIPYGAQRITALQGVASHRKQSGMTNRGEPRNPRGFGALSYFPTCVFDSVSFPKGDTP